MDFMSMIMLRGVPSVHCQLKRKMPLLANRMLRSVIL
jgi:hypothetical protein